jgi:hypothetical protein
MKRDMATITYESDIIAWAQEQVRLLRACQFDALDIEHIADEIEDVGKSEQRELENRMAVLLSHLLKWQHQPERRGSSWQRTIKEQRKAIARRIIKTPSLKSDVQDAEWWEGVWGDALIKAADETGIAFDILPTACPWTDNQVFSDEFYPD